MAPPVRHKDRWIVRASLAGLFVVLCFLAAFSIVTERGVARKSALADRATRLSATYQDARHWVSEEKSIERQYRLEGSYAVKFAHRQAERRLIANLNHVLTLDGSPATHATVTRLLRLQAEYHSAGQALFDAVDANDQERVLAFDHASIDPVFGILEDVVYRQAAASSARALAQSAALRRDEARANNTISVAVAVGLLLLAFFGAIVVRHGRPDLAPGAGGRAGEDEHHWRTLASALARAVDAKDAYTRSHCQTVSQLCGLIGAELGLDAARLTRLRLAGLLHDVGKIGVPDAILKKPARLTGDEYEHMKRHALLGYDIVQAADMELEARWVRHHHERFDGAGYPDGLAGEEIPLESRVILVADAFEAMTSDRPYRQAPGQSFAIRELGRHAGRQFDPEVVGALARVLARAGDVGAAAATPVGAP